MRLLILASLFFLAACAGTADVLESNERIVVLKHSTGEVHHVAAFEVAREQCGKRGKVAVLDRQTCPLSCITQFRCE